MCLAPGRPMPWLPDPERNAGPAAALALPPARRCPHAAAAAALPLVAGSLASARQVPVGRDRPPWRLQRSVILSSGAWALGGRAQETRWGPDPPHTVRSACEASHLERRGNAVRVTCIILTP